MQSFTGRGENKTEKDIKTGHPQSIPPLRFFFFFKFITNQHLEIKIKPDRIRKSKKNPRQISY